MGRRCSVCGRPAVAEVRYAGRSLCREHFIEFVERKVERAVRGHRMAKRGALILAAVSGGKDSATLAGTLSRVLPRLGARLELLHIDLGIPGYSDESLGAAKSLASSLDLPLHVFRVKEVLGAGVPELAVRAGRPVCSVCGTVKRYVMNAAGLELGAHAVATGHNADDLAAYALKAFITGDWTQLAKLGPRSDPIPGLAVAKVKPLYRVYEKESFLYAVLRGLPFYHEECPHARLTTLDFRLKEWVNRLEEKVPGVKLQIVGSAARAREAIRLPAWEPSACPSCGLLSSGGECAFCRLTRRVLGEPMGRRVRESIRRASSIYKGAGGPG